MLGQHFLDVDIGDDGAVLLQGADIDLVRAGRRIDRAQLLIADQLDGVADGRIIGDAALEFRAIAAEDFAQQVDAGAGDVVVGARQILAGDIGDHGDDGGVGAADADEAADGGAHFRRRHLAAARRPTRASEPRTEITRPKEVTVLNLACQRWVWPHYRGRGWTKRLSRPDSGCLNPRHCVQGVSQPAGRGSDEFPRKIKAFATILPLTASLRLNVWFTNAKGEASTDKRAPERGPDAMREQTLYATGN